MRNILNDETRNQLLTKIDEILKQDTKAEYTKKMLAVRAVLQNVAIRTVAASFNVTERAVQIWVNKFINEGYRSLYRKDGSGRPKKLSSDQLFTISDWIEWEDPSFYEANAKDWTGAILAQAIMSEWNIKISEKWCRSFLKNGMYKDPVHKSERTENYGIANRLRNRITDLQNENKVLKQENRELREKLKRCLSKTKNRVNNRVGGSD